MEKVKLKRKVALVLVISILLGLFQINPLKVEATESIESIEIVEAPTEFTAGELIDRSEILVKVNYVTGLSEEITNYKIKHVDKYVPYGLKFLVVEYMGHMASVGITINNPVEDIGIDSKGNPVDLSLWKYKHVTQSDGPGFYELNNYVSAAYIGEIVDGAIIGNVPSYINGVPVKGMNYAFSGLNNLTVMPEIPETVESMIGTFKNAINITGVFEYLPNIKINDDMFFGTTQPITKKVKSDVKNADIETIEGNITIIRDRVKSMRITNLNDFKIGMNLSKENMEIELEYESGYTRKITENEKLNYLTFHLEGNSVNFSRILKSYDIGKTISLKYQVAGLDGALFTEVIIEDLDVFGIEISGVNKIPFSLGETVQNSDLSVTDKIFGDNIEDFNILYPTNVLTLEDTYVEVEFQGYKATANINVEEATIPDGEVNVLYVNNDMLHIKNQDIYYYPIGEEITINAPEIEGYKIAEGSSYQSVIPDANNPQYIWFYYEEIVETGTGTITIEYCDNNSFEILSSQTQEYETGIITIYADNIPVGYNLPSYATNPQTVILDRNEVTTVTFYVEQMKGNVSIEKWVDNNFIYWSNTEQLPVGIHTLNEYDYYTDSNYVLVGDSSKTIEVLEGQTTTVRFDYKEAPQGIVNIHLKLEDGTTYQTMETQKPIGEQTINVFDHWGNNLYEIVGESVKTVLVSEEFTTTVEFILRKLATGNVNKIAKYNGEILGQYEEELPIGLQDVYAPWVNNLYETSESVKQVEVVEGATVDVIFNYTKQSSYFVKRIGKDNVSNEVLYEITEEKSLNDTNVGASRFDGEDNYDMLGDYWRQVENPQEGETVEIIWLYQKASTGWVRVIVYNEEMVEIYNQLVEVRAEGAYVDAPDIDTGIENTWYETDKQDYWVENAALSPETAETLVFNYTIVSDSSGSSDPEEPIDNNNQQSDILLTVKPTNFRATVPFKVDIHMSNEGVITVGQGYKITNECPLGQIVMVDIEITPSNGWSLVDISEDFNNKKIGSKVFGLSMNESVALNGKIPLNTSLSETIRNGGSKDLVFDAKLVGQTVETNQVISNIVIVLDFWK